MIYYIVSIGEAVRKVVCEIIFFRKKEKQLYF